MDKMREQTKAELEIIWDLFKEIYSLVERKNADYSYGEDFFKNFRQMEDIGISADVGILVRMGDKWERLKNFYRKGKYDVSEETILDTLKDLIGYAAIMYVWHKERGKYENKTRD